MVALDLTRPRSAPPDLTLRREQTRGRGAQANVSGRFETHSRILFDDGWQSLEDLAPFKTTVMKDTAKSIISHNESPDVGFDRSINPYRGCEHGCVYCYARPSHAYMGLSPGLDFEAKLFAKPNAAELLRKELSHPGYSPQTIVLGVNTDCYQPIERQWRITRQLLEVMLEFSHPVALITKSALVLRDLDLLQALAAKNLVKVAISITTLDAGLARLMEPRAATPAKRLSTLEILSKAGIPTTIMMAPVIPALNDSEIDRILAAAAAAGAKEAGYVFLRLPREVRDIFADWLKAHFPDRAERVLSLVRQSRGGAEYQAEFGTRMVGTGPYAWMVGRRFELAMTRLGLNARKYKLATEHFRVPPRKGEQLTLL